MSHALTQDLLTAYMSQGLFQAPGIQQCMGQTKVPPLTQGTAGD